MIGPYFDTGVALKLVVEEPLSPVVRGFVQRRRLPVLFSRLVELEIECALQALLFRQIISGRQLAEARALVRQLVHRGQFLKVDLSLDKIAAETLSLAPVCTAGTGCRTLDRGTIRVYEGPKIPDLQWPPNRLGDPECVLNHQVIPNAFVTITIGLRIEVEGVSLPTQRHGAPVVGRKWTSVGCLFDNFTSGFDRGLILHHLNGGRRNGGCGDGIPVFGHRLLGDRFFFPLTLTGGGFFPEPLLNTVSSPDNPVPTRKNRERVSTSTPA